MKPKVQTWLRQIELGNIKTNHTKVLSYIKRCVMATNIHEMRLHLGMPHQTLTATLSVLMDYGLIKSVGEGVVIKGNTYSELKFVYDEEERKILEAERKLEKFRQWIVKGIEDYTPLLPMDLSIKLQILLNNY